jgi:glycosyltransferase involved in cell wall biosynthesis
VSKEIESLRVGPRVHAPVVAFSPANRTKWLKRERTLLLAHRRWLMLRAIAQMVERQGDVTHIFGGLSSWHLLRSLGRRPIVLTAVISGAGGALPSNVRPARVVIETEDSMYEWLAAGVPRDRIELIRPGVDVEWFAPAPPPTSTRLTLLFASTPSDPVEFGPRGLPLLCELARIRPDLDVLIPWRQWGDMRRSHEVLAQLHPPANVLIEHNTCADMRDYFGRAHATIVAFERGTGKACPNFVVEGFACGRPCVTTDDGSLSALVTGAGAGVTTARDANALSQAIDHCLADWSRYSRGARALAEAQFNARRFRHAYERIYGEIASERRPTR